LAISTITIGNNGRETTAVVVWEHGHRPRDVQLATLGVFADDLLLGRNTRTISVEEDSPGGELFFEEFRSKGLQQQVAVSHFEDNLLFSHVGEFSFEEFGSAVQVCEGSQQQVAESANFGMEQFDTSSFDFENLDNSLLNFNDNIAASNQTIAYVDTAGVSVAAVPNDPTLYISRSTISGSELTMHTGSPTKSIDSTLQKILLLEMNCNCNVF
jgi:hypothetical protein